MRTSSVEESVPLFSRSGIPTAVRDTRRPHEKQLAIYLILASVLFERLAFYSVAAVLVLNLESGGPFYWKSPNGSTAAYIFSGTSRISTLIFAVISDAKLGRFKTIIVGFFLYLIGYIFGALITNDGINKSMCRTSNESPTSDTKPLIEEYCAGWVLGTLVIIGVGAGAVEANMTVFGAEQIQESKITSRYFDKYMVAVNIGSIIETLIIPYIQDTDESHIFIGYIVAAGMLFVAAVLFIIGCRYYIHAELNETVIANCIPVIKNAFQTWRQYERDQRLIDTKHTNSATSNFLDASHSLTHEEVEESIRTDERPSTFLDFAKIGNRGKFHDRIVDDVKSLRSAIIVFTLLIPYWLVYNQLYTAFQSQGQHMTGGDAKYIVSWMSLGDTVTIVIGILIFNMFVYKYLDARNRSLTIITKFVIGMCFSFLSMCIAGIVEVSRQDQCSPNHGKNESNLIVYAQLPQNIGIGLSELFATVASYEYAYFAAPRSAQSLFMSLHFFSIGISSYIGSAYMAVFSAVSHKLDLSCPPENKKYPSFYTYFFILAGLQLIFIIIFIVCQKKFRIVKLNPQQMETNQFLRYSSTSSTARQ